MHFAKVFLMALAALILQPPAPGRAEQSDAAALRLLEPAEITEFELARRMSGRGTTPLIFDTRTRAEFDVSHLKNSHWLDATMSSERFLAAYGHRTRGSLIVFYCTMSLRSVGFALQVMDRLEAHGARRIAVLKGGIIGWANAALPLEDAFGSTTFVHPFNPETIASLRQPELARFTPRH